MGNNRDFLKMILIMARGTADNEIGCVECWEAVDRFAELRLIDRSTDEAMGLVGVHLEHCADCADEFRALLDALQATTPNRVLLERHAAE